MSFFKIIFGVCVGVHSL